MTKAEMLELSIRSRMYLNKHGTKRMGVLGAVVFSGFVLKPMWSTRVKIYRTPGLDIFRHWGEQDGNKLECNDHEQCAEVLSKLRVEQVLDNLANIDL